MTDFPGRRSRTGARPPPNPAYAGIRVDSNFFDDSIGATERAAADALMELSGESLSIVVPHTVRAELAHANTPAASRRRANELPFTYDTGMGDRERRMLAQQIMRGNARPEKHAKDALHLLDAAAWQAAYFVTCDGRIHRKASEIRDSLGLWVVKPSELLAIYQAFIAQTKDEP